MPKGVDHDQPSRKSVLRRLVVAGVFGLLLIAVGLAFWLDPFGIKAALGGHPEVREKRADEKPLEVSLVPPASFKSLDKGKTGKLTRAELRGLPFFGPLDNVADNFKAIDVDKDGAIDAAEYDAYLKKWWNRIAVPADVQESLGIRHGEKVALAAAQVPAKTRPLVMPGSTDLDPTQIARIRARFNAAVVELGTVPGDSGEAGSTPSEKPLPREVRPGDFVHGPHGDKPGDLLAVVWSTDVGSRKSDLVDALVQLTLDQRRYEDRLRLYKEGSIPFDTVEQTRRDVASDRNAVARAERTLRTWNVPQAEIDAVEEEAKHIVERGGKRDKKKEELWARSEMRAPRDGTVVERNVVVGEYIADNTNNLFVIADVDRLLVRASPPEDDLKLLLDLPKKKQRWTINAAGVLPIEAPIAEISYIIDANQHTAVVKGYIENPGNRLRAGQYVTATVDLPPPTGVVEIPVSALVDDCVLVEVDGKQSVCELRRVKVTHRFADTIYVSSKPIPAQEALTPEERDKGLLPRQPLSPGARVLTAGVLELKARLAEIKSSEK